jgi:outer membrane immunogenic protein
MKTRIIGGVAALAMCGTSLGAFAADLPPRMAAPVYAPAMAPAPVFSWSGFYIGAHLGWGTARKEWSQTSPTTGSSFGNAAAFDADGVIGGGQIGYNLQTGSWVWGIEADFTGSDLNGSGVQTHFAGPSPLWTSVSDIHWFGTVTGRLGFVWDRVLIYGKGGFAWADETHSQTFSSNAFPITTQVSSVDKTHTGWVVGGGIETALWGAWTGKVEYNYFDLGTENLGFANGSPIPSTSSRATDAFDIKQRFHVVKFGLNYKWGGGLPF